MFGLSVHGLIKTGTAPTNASVTQAKDCGQAQESSCNREKAFEKPIFDPCMLRRTWGTASRTEDFGGEIKSARARRRNLEKIDDGPFVLEVFRDHCRFTRLSLQRS